MRISPIAKEVLDNLAETDDPFELLAEYEGCGICLSCGDIREGCEPDAEEYECWSCGDNAVMGFESAITSYL